MASQIGVVVMSEQDAFVFSHADEGMTRFPPNVEQISVEHEHLRTWLTVRRNDVKLRFPLCEADCRHLAALLMDHQPTENSIVEDRE